MSSKPLPIPMEKNFAAAFVDQLFAEPIYTFGVEPITPKEVVSSSSTLQGTNKKAVLSMPDMQKKKNLSTKKEDGGRKVLDEAPLPRKRNDQRESSSGNISAAEAWKEIQKACNSLPQIRGVDERAEEFISKFRQDMKLERERSLVEFHEMLARGV